jgi:hypothetical protein
VWGNSVYLEWFSERNGRVVVELTGCQIGLTEPEWRLTPEEEWAQQRANTQAMRDFVRLLGATLQDLPDPTSPGSPGRSP